MINPLYYFFFPHENTNARAKRRIRKNDEKELLKAKIAKLRAEQDQAAKKLDQKLIDYTADALYHKKVMNTRPANKIVKDVYSNDKVLNTIPEARYTKIGPTYSLKEDIYDEHGLYDIDKDRKNRNSAFGTLFLLMKNQESYGIANVMIPNRTLDSVTRTFHIKEGETIVGYRFVQNITHKVVAEGKIANGYFKKAGTQKITIRRSVS